MFDRIVRRGVPLAPLSQVYTPSLSAQFTAAMSMPACVTDCANEHARNAVADPGCEALQQWLVVPVFLLHGLRALFNRDFEAAAKFARESGVVDQHVGLAREQQAE